MAFLKSRSAKEATNHIHSTNSPDDAFAKIFRPVKSVKHISFIEARSNSLGDRVAYYKVRCDGDTKEVLLRSQPDKPFKVDWQSFYTYGSISFQSYLETFPPESHSTYCYLFQDYSYTKKYNSSSYQSYRLRNYLGNRDLRAVVQKGSKTHQKLTQAFRQNKIELYGCSTLRAALTIKKIEGTPKPMVEIESVLSDQWHTMPLAQ